MNPLARMQQVIVSLSERAQARDSARAVRKAAVLLARTVGRRPSDRAERLRGLAETAATHAAEVATWVSPEALARGEGGPFDACDLRHWLALAWRAGVPAVRAREILRLGEAEMSALSGRVAPPGGDAPPAEPSPERRAALEEVMAAVGAIVGPGEAVDAEALAERLAAAMDGVPEGWMVRSARCGSSNLKALSGAGLAGPEVPEVRFSNDLELGPGWVRVGNRRRVEAADERTVSSYAEGPGGELAFLARPWVRPARLLRCDDPHRSGTRVEGPGWWPVELRAYVVRGVVEGVSSYFSWCPLEVDPSNARMMLETRALAQRLADVAVAQRAFPRYMDVEFVRSSGHPGIAGDPRQRELLAEFGREEVAFTVDFLEVDAPDGPRLVMLEAGPSSSPYGGGHSCGFSGVGGPPRMGTRPATRGAAFQSMAHVVIGDMRTWREGDVAGRILSWDEVEALAASDGAGGGVPAGA